MEDLFRVDTTQSHHSNMQTLDFQGLLDAGVNEIDVVVKYAELLHFKKKIKDEEENNPKYKTLD